MNLSIAAASVLILSLCAYGADPDKTAPATQPSSVLDFTLANNAGTDVPLSHYKGKVLMIVNTASKCGFTHEYKGLEEIYNKYKDKGFDVLAFPANDFNKQEPGTNEQIREFCTNTFNVTFDLFAKITVKGDQKAPLYEFLTSKTTDPTFGGEIEWNFTKFLISRDGKIVARFKSKIEPTDPQVIKAIEEQLDQK